MGMSGAFRPRSLAFWLLVAIWAGVPRVGVAASAEEVEASVNAALVRLKEQVPGSDAVLEVRQLDVVAFIQLLSIVIVFET